jgi:2-haloacid dehalogenase
MSYTSIFFDLDNTLLDFNKAEYFAAQNLFKKHNLPFDDNAIKTYSKINLSFWKRFESGEIKKEDIFENRFIEFCRTYGKTADTKQMAPEYFEFLSQGYYVIDGALEVLKYLKSKNYKLYATTNGVALTQYRRIENSGLKPYFDKIFVSEEAGFQKPSKEYFNYVVKNIPEKDKEKMLIIGDSQSSDILGGINSGIDTCWYNPKSEKSKYYSKFEITDLSQIKTIL